MAPAVLASLNEPSLQGQCGVVFMRKYVNHSVADSNNPVFIPNPNPNPNPNSCLNSNLTYRNNSSKQFDDSLVYGGYATFNLAGYTASQLKELKKRLTSELEQVRILRERIESGAFDTREVSALRSGPALSFAGETNDVAPKKKKKKNGPGQKRINPFGNEQSYPKRLSAMDPESGKVLAGMMETCGQILGKLMKHKWAWVFNTPVDVVGLGLHDYYQIVKKPMDLGTIKTNLEKGSYGSPLDFASDVRLTFNNAMAYNPKGQDVYLMAERLLGQFEGMFNPACRKFEAQQSKASGSSSRPEPEFEQRGLKHNQTTENLRKGPEQISVAKKLESVKPQPTLTSPVVESPDLPSPSPQQQPPPPPPQPPALPQSSQVEAPQDVGEMVKARKGKLPKPKAKDPNKRQMTMEEKAKLGLNLQDLPPEKLGQLVQILKKRNRHLAQDGDEIELDIEAIDNETLWELDRFVTNYKKMVSKIKRQGFIRNNISTPPRNLPPATEMGIAEKKGKKGDAGEEDVDIGEDIPIENYPSVEIEKDGTAAAASSGSSSSGSSSSSSSSSSDSESGSSSGSDSDAESVQSPFVESKEAG